MNRRLLHYEILGEIGRGGMGVVYQARDTRLDRMVAVKLLPADKVADPERKQRFIQEAKAASALNHPGIVTIHEINADDGVDFIVMEYLEGRTLDALIPSKGMRAAQALKYAVQIADALAGSISPDLEKIILRCLRKDPARRYQTMADLKVALEDVASESGSGRQARAPSWRPWAWAALVPVLVAAS